MGIDLALLFALHKYVVTVWHRHSAGIARSRLHLRLEAYAKRGILSEDAATRLEREIAVTSSHEDAGSADLIIESVAEDFSIKSKLLAQFDELISNRGLLATNTSSISVNALQRGLTAPAEFAGFHFFNPALKMTLVEIVAGSLTSHSTVEMLKSVAARLDKTSVTVGDTPGFIVNKLLAIQINCALRLLESQAASAHDIDLAIVHGLGHRIGPLALADLIGLDVLYNILVSIFEATGDFAYKPASILKELIDRSHLGRKTGQGIFDYRKDGIA
ncbi:MAG: 3-hydroxyacyl-CoA dehydrogenase family protein [Candidatus Marinimicrobia bacterium]|nr:3-hydroxyacyl-CoA dehydrogenase family protein [Candidatus Neomarinimicrobiota bacterium]